MKTRHIRLGTVSGDLAEKISQALDNEDVLWYRPIGPRLLDVYKEEYK